jgi:pimeloyl-ACP methyl ester carboxylesterase
MATGRIHVYGTIIGQDLKAKPGSRYVVFVPEKGMVRQTAAELRFFDVKVGCVSDGNVFLEDDADVYVSSYEDAGLLAGRSFRIKVVEESEPTKMKKLQQSYETQVRRGINAELSVHFAMLNPKRNGGSLSANFVSQHLAEEEAGWLGWMSKPYNMMWKAIIRPPRASYTERDLGISTFVFGNHVYEREDVDLENGAGHKLACSHFYMRGGQALRQLCVVYLHGNCSSRLEAFYVLPALLARGLSVFCLDLAGSGLSGGEYISLGHHEEKDVSVVLNHLRQSGTASAIALWGRSMGAAAAMLRASEDPDLAACVLDSPFADLKVVVEEYVTRMNLHIPNFVLSACLAKVRSEILERAGFDPYELAPVRHAPDARCPALFAVAHDDAFILPHHTLDLHNAWGGERLLSQFAGGHSGKRPSWFLDEAADFLLEHLCSWSMTRREELSENSKTEKRRVFAL